ncbi:MAG: polysaccharide biosynthesis tyrosine autokinase [Pseudomonadota bacterium]|nr:polysaccharide biosynthesis tyrosine autokinase [Pseudomonadota bacterium]MDP2351173.1 polysaccharide biosynthesis tyrosine autokinase [Pseudomonadota bacterium]
MPMSADQINAAPNAIAEDSEDEINLGEIFATLLEYKWLIAAVTSLSLLLGAAGLYVATPIYKADALLQVEDQKGTGGLTALKELQPLLGDSTSVAAQQEILNSRMILGRVVDKIKLDIVAKPVYMPIFGKAKARRHAALDLAEPLFGMSKYAWGGEEIKVESLEVPQVLIGEVLTLIAGKAGRYELFDEDDNKLLEGQVGQPVAAREIKLFVSRLNARPGTHFTLTKLPPQDAITALRENFSVKERAKLSGVLETTLQGSDVELLPRILNEIINSYVRQNVEFRSAEAENTLKFLEVQLPLLKTQVDNAESAFNAYRQSRGSVDLAMETQGVLASIVDVDKETVKLQQMRDELRQQFTPEHPRMLAMDSQLERLKAKRGQFDSRVSRLPATQQTILRLQRDVEVSNKLYIELLNSAQQLRVSKAGTIGDARIIDSAVVASKPISPKGALILAVAFILGLLLSIVLIWVIRSLRVMVEDPDKIEKQIGLPVYATIPHSKTEVTLANEIKHGKKKGELLAIDYPEDDAVESLRSLRTTIHFALLDASKGSLLITGPSPGIGKSFISKNLAVVLAQSGKRVAIIDADLRKGHIHREFDMAREVGVSEYVSGTASLSEIIKPTLVEGLSVITTGQRPPNPSELLMHAHFGELLEQLGDLFDILIVDAPPILAVSDAAIIGRHTGATLMVARAGKHPIREIDQAVKRLAQAGVQVKGFVFNDMDTVRQRYRYGYHGYVYSYSYKKN